MPVLVICTIAGAEAMAITEVSYTEARERLAELWDRALADREPIRLTRRGSKPVVLLAADEYEGLLETAHLLRSPANAARLLRALERARSREGEPQELSDLRAAFDASDEQ
jgi:antitoxin YefM